MRDRQQDRAGTIARYLAIFPVLHHYISKKEKRDWESKVRIEEVLREHPAYGSRSIATALFKNRKGIQRVMRRFGIKPYRRVGRKWRKKKHIQVIYPNLLLQMIPVYPNHV